MTKDEMNHDEEQDKLKFENELKRIKLSLEKGAVFSNPGNSENLPPEIENEFLNHVEAFEKVYENAEQISVYDFIGRPDYLKADSIPDDNIGIALENIMDVMNENGIVLDVICDVEDRVLYTFITEELFLHEIDNIRIPGMTTNFIYEEFHPNHEHDIRDHSEDFIKTLLDKESEYYTTFISREAENSKVFSQFRDSYTAFKLTSFRITDLTYAEEKASVTFKADFTAMIENSNEAQHFKGQGTMELVYQYDFWCVHKVNFPSVI